MFRRTLVRLLIVLSGLYQRLLVIIYAVIGPERAYAFTAFMARALYNLLPPLRDRTEGQLAAALGRELSPPQIRRIAAESFIHRAWNLTDLMLAQRWLTGPKLDQRGGRIPPEFLEPLLAAQRRGQPLILLTAYYGPYELLPILLGRNGVRAVALYREHENRLFDTFRRRIRGLGGCELVSTRESLFRLPQMLESGGAVALVADHHVGRRGVSATFFGLPTLASRAVGVLALRHQADVVVAGVLRAPRQAGLRLREGRLETGPTWSGRLETGSTHSFHFSMTVVETIRHTDVRDADDPVAEITHRYLAAIERLVRLDPSQYAWTHARWGAEHANASMAAPTS